MADNDDRFIEVKVYSGGIFPAKAKEIVSQGVVGVISGGKISVSAKAVFEKAGVWYRENVEPEDLEPEAPEVEGEN